MTTFIETWVEESRQQGMQAGIRAGLLDGIESALDLKFGAAGIALIPEIRAFEDVDALRAIHAATITATTPEDVRAAY